MWTRNLEDRNAASLEGPMSSNGHIFVDNVGALRFTTRSETELFLVVFLSVENYKPGKVSHLFMNI